MKNKVYTTFMATALCLLAACNNQNPGTTDPQGTSFGNNTDFPGLRSTNTIAQGFHIERLDPDDVNETGTAIENNIFALRGKDIAQLKNYFVTPQIAPSGTKIPLGLLVSKARNICDGTEDFESINSEKELAESYNKNWGGTVVNLSYNNEFQKDSRKLSKNTTNSFKRSQRCILYTIEIDNDDVQFSDAFIAAKEDLSTTCEAVGVACKNAIEKFTDRFGTHYATSIDYGGFAEMTVNLSSSELAKIKDEENKDVFKFEQESEVEAGVDIKIFSAKAKTTIRNAMHNDTSTIKTQSDGLKDIFEKRRTQEVGGTGRISENNFEVNHETVVPVMANLAHIYDLIDDDKLKAQMKKHLDEKYTASPYNTANYINYIQLVSIVKKPSPLPPPPPPPPVKRATHIGKVMLRSKFNRRHHWRVEGTGSNAEIRATRLCKPGLPDCTFNITPSGDSFLIFHKGNPVLEGEAWAISTSGVSKRCGLKKPAQDCLWSRVKYQNTGTMDGDLFLFQPHNDDSKCLSIAHGPKVKVIKACSEEEAGREMQIGISELGPKGEHVELFENCDYKGRSWKVGTGVYSYEVFKKFKMIQENGHGSTSSIRVPEGFKVTMNGGHNLNWGSDVYEKDFSCIDDIPEEKKRKKGYRSMRVIRK